MVFWIIVGLILAIDAVIVTAIISDECGYGYGVGDAIFTAIFAFFIASAFGGMFGGLIYSAFNENFETIDTTTPYKTKIVSLTSGNNLSGSFFLGCGSIEGKEYYYYYVQRKDGNFVREKLPVDKSSIKEMPEGAEFTPHIAWDVLTYKNPKWVGPNFSSPSHSEYVFVVPNGTIIQRYELR